MSLNKGSETRDDLLKKLSREFLNTEIAPMSLPPERIREIKRLEKEQEIREWLSQRSNFAKVG